MPKSLLLAPERVALALLADGWCLRNKAIWAKSNPMPSSVADRLTCTYEVVYFFTRGPRYYFDLDAIRAPFRSAQGHPAANVDRTYPPGAGAPTRDGRTANPNRGLSTLRASGRVGHPLGKNPGDVWTLPTAGYRGAHFATFPLGLVERPLLATCPASVCQRCGVPTPKGCACGAQAIPGVVLDPFFGAGTTGLAAERHGRDWLGVELSPDYAALAEARIAASRPRRTTAPPNQRKETPYGTATHQRSR
jgi:site-specific DNA-methyltransferase (adenine-specific)